MKKIKIQLIERCTNKLSFVKLIKDCTELGLKDSKDVCDRLHDRPGTIEEILVKDGLDENNNTYAQRFINGMKNIEGKFNVNGGTQWERNIKMLSLGIGEVSEYVDFTAEFITDNRNLEISKSILNFVLSKLSKSELQETFDEIMEKSIKSLII